MLNLCQGGRGIKSHEEICFEGNQCPLCEKWEELEVKIAELKETIEELKEEE